MYSRCPNGTAIKVNEQDLEYRLFYKSISIDPIQSRHKNRFYQFLLSF